MADNPRATLLGAQDREHLEQDAEEPEKGDKVEPLLSRSESFALFRFISPIPIFKSATSTLLHQSARLVALRPAWGSYSAALELTGGRARTIAKTVYL